MKVLVDTSVWSLALRRGKRAFPPLHQAVTALTQLIDEARVAMMGAVRQEILSGVRDQAAFERLRDRLRAFPDEPVGVDEHERAAEFFNRCRAKGVQGSNTDFLICAMAERYRLAILTTDDDFRIYRRHLPITLYQVPTADR